MRRLVALVGLAALGLTACAAEPLVPVPYRSAVPAADQASIASEAAATTAATASAESVAPAETQAPVDECRALAESLPVEVLAGQVFMVGVNAGGLDPVTRSAIDDHGIGSVVLLGNSTAGLKPIRDLTLQLGSMGSAQLPMLIAVDQEGGSVQRLKGPGFSTMPSARDQGAMAPEDLRAAAQLWASELKAAGIHYDLAPDADIVPEAKRTTNEPIGRLKRDYGADPPAVSESVVAFIDGMRAEGLATSAKHFPGLGEVTTNTDFGAAQDSDVTRTSNHLEPFRAAIEAGVDSVMVSSAVFTQIDPDNEGVFSSAVITDLLRGDLGFEGVVIADDLGSAVAVKGVSPGDRAVRFIRAGGDIVINANPRIMGDMVAATLEAAATDAEFSAQLTDSAVRVMRLKSAVGLMGCA